MLSKKEYIFSNWGKMKKKIYEQAGGMEINRNLATVPFISKTAYGKGMDSQF